MKRAWVFCFCIVLLPAFAHSQKVFLNPSNQTENSVACGGNEAQYALINANNAAEVLRRMGFDVVVDQDFSNAPIHANSWGADVFVSVHSNAGGGQGHGTETLYKTQGGMVLAQAVQDGLLSFLPYQSRGLKHRDDLYVLNATSMYACLAEVVFHDCTAVSGFQGHPPSESCFLVSTEGQTKIGNGLAFGTCKYFRDNCSTSGPTTGFFKGFVYIAPDMNQRVQGALVTLNTGQTFVTTSTGYFEFEVPPGTYTATAHKDGYIDNSSTRTVVAGKEVWGSIGLTPIVASDEGKGDEEVFIEEVMVEEPVVEEGEAGAEIETFGDEGIWVWRPPEKPEPEKAEVSEESLEVTPIPVPEQTCPRGSRGGGCNAGANYKTSLYFLFVSCALMYLTIRRCVRKVQ